MSRSKTTRRGRRGPTRTRSKTNKSRSKSKTRSRSQSSHIRSITLPDAPFSSGEGMMTAVWGPALWHYLHTMSFNYPVRPSTTDKKNYAAFIKQLRHVLPCKYCRINLAKNFKTKPLTAACLANRDAFSRYVYALHELVNKMLLKPPGPSYERVRDDYEKLRSKCSPAQKSAELSPHKGTRKNRSRSTTTRRIMITPADASGTNPKKESGCVTPLNGVKKKCVIKIVSAK